LRPFYWTALERGLFSLDAASVLSIVEVLIPGPTQDDHAAAFFDPDLIPEADFPHFQSQGACKPMARVMNSGIKILPELIRPCLRF
jgi:hypothetical protein